MIPGLRDNTIARLSLQRPIAMLMVLFTALVLGVVALVRIPLELIPSGFSPPFMSVRVPYADSTARDVEDKITKPIEQALSTTPGLKEMSTTSNSGEGRVTLVFEGDTDMNMAYREVRERVNRVRPDLPKDVRRVEIHKASGSGFPVAFYGIVWDPAVEEPYRIVQRELARRIERIDGVAVVNVWGQRDPEIRIEVDRVRAEAAGVDLVDVVARLGRSNFTLASGSVREAGDRYVLRSLASYRSLTEIENLVVGDKNLRVRDVADVVYAPPEVDRYDRYNGKPSMVMFVLKESQANTVAVCDAIKAAVEEATAAPAMRDFGVEPIFLQGDTIRTSLQQVVTSGLQGGAFAIFILLFFLRRMLLTLCITASIPLSLFLALPVMYFSGQSINLVSLIGLMICVGMVVDNSVVVAENIVRYRARGLGPYVAALHGTGEVALAITLATATSMIVFLPAALLSSGPTQFFMIRMVTPVCVALLASLFVALMLVPPAAALILDRESGQPPADRSPRGLARVGAAIAGAADTSVSWLGEAYARVLRASLRRRIDVVVVSLLALASTAIPFRYVQFTGEQNFGSRNVNVYYSMPSETSLEDADAFFREIERVLGEQKQELGIAGYYVGFSAGFGEIDVFFEPGGNRDEAFKDLAKRVVDLLPERPGWDRYSRASDSDGAKEEAFTVAIYGESHEVVQEVRDDLSKLLEAVPGVVAVQNRGQDSRRRDELALAVDREMGERYGIAATMVANTVAYAIRGAPLPRYQADDKEVDVWLRYRKDDREVTEDLDAFRVKTREGKRVPIEVLTTPGVQVSEASLNRHNKRVAAIVRLELDPEQREATMGRIQRFLDAYRLPEGVTFDADHEARDVAESLRDLALAMLLGTVFIFLIMGFLFESFILPLSVLPSIPLSFVGVWWFLFLAREGLDPLAGIGVILLLGVVVNNGIVLVDFINGARQAGLDRTEAIVQAGRQRLRPILMTALTTIVGLLPLAFSEPTGEGIPYGPFGKTLVGGLLVSTLLTLVVVPVAYTFFDDLRKSAGGWAGTLLRAARGRR